MSSEDQEALLNQISQLAGQINRHKNGQVSGQQDQLQHGYGGYPQASTGWGGGRGSYRGSRGSRGYYRGGRHNHLHRHKSLVLNASSAPSTSTNENNNLPAAVDNNAWISKTDRGHRQIVSATVFEKETRHRVKSMEELRLQKLKRRDQLERAKLEKNIKAEKTREVNVGGGVFRVSETGGKLEKISGTGPKMAIVSGIKFYRSKNGNMYRDTSIKIQGKSKKTTKLCKAFNLTGSCSLADCPFVHDPSKVAVCRDFLQKGSCPSGDFCDLSHELTPERTPICLHFARGNCSNDNCRYTHVRVSPSALVCRSFGIYGYCENGASCTDRHVNECPDFSNTGTCTTEGCKLLHRQKASVMRSNTDPNKQSDSMIHDVSSDEEGVGSDVDSDGLEEFLGDEEGEIDEDIPKQQDFVPII
ncbi:hypothetical protein ONS96_003369 [Cadophora gregata f. sp. sojae]|nr:hypothetical protein ONS96_003369 [Cadophora gregata f. sp. sojae]